MRTQSLASVLGEMEAGKARQLTELLADPPAAPEASP
jgi:flagellar motility protein MotE (MotC chaperone)